ELQFPEVAVQGVVLPRKCGEEDVGQSVSVEIGNLGSHASHRFAVHVEPGVGGVGDVLESSVTFVAVEEIAYAVVGDKDVGPAIEVDVADLDAESLAGAVGDSGFD